MSHLTIEVQKRDTRGKNANRKLRAAGQVPAVVYGAGKDSVAIQVGKRELDDLMRTASSDNVIFLLKMAGTDQSRHTMIREMQRNAVNGELFHVDFQRVLLDQKTHASVQIHLHGEPFGVKTEGGLLDFVTREIEVECLPDKIPPHIDVDVSEMRIGQHIEVKELELPEAVELLGDETRTIVSITAKKGVAEEEAEEEEEGLLEAATSEPEVIGKGKDDDD